jgi:hypothetical protein
MVVDDFGSGIGLVWIIGSSLLVNFFCPLLDNNPCPLWDSNPCPLWDSNPCPLWATTLVLCGTSTLVLYGTHHPLWLSFHLIGWFGLWLGFRLSFGDSLGQGCEATI